MMGEVYKMVIGRDSGSTEALTTALAPHKEAVELAEHCAHPAVGQKNVIAATE